MMVGPHRPPPPPLLLVVLTLGLSRTCGRMVGWRIGIGGQCAGQPSVGRSIESLVHSLFPEKRNNNRRFLQRPAWAAALGVRPRAKAKTIRRKRRQSSLVCVVLSFFSFLAHEFRGREARRPTKERECPVPLVSPLSPSLHSAAPCLSFASAIYSTAPDGIRPQHQGRPLPFPSLPFPLVSAPLDLTLSDSSMIEDGILVGSSYYLLASLYSAVPLSLSFIGQPYKLHTRKHIVPTSPSPSQNGP